MNKALEEVSELITGHELDKAADRLSGIRSDDDELQIEKLYLEGHLLEKQHDWQAAAAKYRQVLERDPDHTETLFRLAYILDLHGDDDEALALYERCIQEPPAHVNALLNLAVLYEDRGRYEEAYDLVESVVEQMPNNIRARMYLKDLESSLTMYYDEDRERSREKHGAILDIPIGEFEFSIRTRNCLKQNNIHRLGDLLRVTEERLLACKNFGETSLNEVKAMLDQKGLRLGQALEEGPPAPQRTSSPLGQPLVSAGDPNLMNRSVAELELSVRSRKCLQRLGVSTVGELTQRTEAELLSTKNFGQTSLNEIKRRLSELGLSLRESKA